MEEKAVMLHNLVESLHLHQITGDQESLKRWIVTPDVNRPGLELTGYYLESEMKRVNILGNKELSYIETLDEETQRERFELITDAFTPCIIISSNRHCPNVLREIAANKNFPIFSSMLKSSILLVDIVGYLDKYLAPTTNLHGCLLSIHGRGVLIMGESGVGKSEITLELIRKGHVMIADDAVNASRIQNRILGSAPELLYGMLEIRGIGVIDAIKMYGASSVMPEIYIDCAISLERIENKDFQRIPLEEQHYIQFLGVDIPKIIVPVREGRSTATIIESAVTNFNLNEMGFNSNIEFDQRVKDYIRRNN